MKRLLLLIKRSIVNLYRRVMQFYYNVASNRFECSVGDILLLRDVIHTNQFLLTSRLLDIETYLDGTDKTFPYQNAISFKAYGKEHKEESGNYSFRKLIESYLKDGYRKDSYITCDRDMNLMDGNHRMGIHIHEGIETINVRRVKRRIPFEYGIDWYYEVGLTSEFIERVLVRFDNIQKWLISKGMTFCAYIQGKNSEILIQDMTHLCHVLKISSIGNNTGWLVLFSIPRPSYLVKNGTLFSQRAFEIERILRKRVNDGAILIVSKNCMEGQQLYNQYYNK